MRAGEDHALDPWREETSDPFGGETSAAIADVTLIGLGIFAALAPFLAVFIVTGMRGQDSAPVMLAACALAVAAPPLLVSRFGTPSDAVRRRAGMDVAVAFDIAPAPRWRRALAWAVDAAVLSGTSIALIVPLALLALTFAVLAPLAFVPLAALLAVWIALCARGRRPGARLPSPGLVACALARVRGPEGTLTVLASDLPAIPRRGVRIVGVVVAWLGVLVSVPVVALVALSLAQAVLSGT